MDVMYDISMQMFRKDTGVVLSDHGQDVKFQEFHSELSAVNQTVNQS